MRIKIISDLFVDEQNIIDGQFYHSDETFIDYLKKSMINYTYVIINGNLLNCWKSDFILQKLKVHHIAKSRSLLYNFIKNNLVECNYKIKYITDCIKPSKNLIYVSGNNDAVCEDIFKDYICKAVIVSLFDKNIYISHGHQAYFNTNVTCLGKKLSKCFGIYGLIDDDLDNNFSNLELTAITNLEKTGN
jgi:predicted phosphodiesterase